MCPTNEFGPSIKVNGFPWRSQRWWQCSFLLPLCLPTSYQAQHFNVLVTFVSQSFSISHLVNKLWRMHKGGHLSKKQENKVNIILCNKEKTIGWKHKNLLDKTIIFWIHLKESKIPHKKWTCNLWNSCLQDLDHIICQIFNLEYYQYNNQKKKNLMILDTNSIHLLSFINCCTWH
jgi:hypothetical protein